MAEAVLNDDLTKLANLIAMQAERRRQAELEHARRVVRMQSPICADVRILILFLFTATT